MASLLIHMLGGVAHGADLTLLLERAVSEGRHALASGDHQQLADFLVFCSHTLNTDPRLLGADDLELVVRELCFPVLSTWSADCTQGDRSADESALVQVTCEFLSSLVLHPLKSSHKHLAETIMGSCVVALSNYRDELHSRSQLSHDFGEVDTSKSCDLSISSAVLLLELVCKAEQCSDQESQRHDSPLESWWQEVTDTLLDLLELADPKTCVRLAQILVPDKQVPFAKRTSLDTFRLIWERFVLQLNHTIKYSESVKENIFLVLCALCGTYLPKAAGHDREAGDDEGIPASQGTTPPQSLNMLECHEFWMLIQHGLIHSSPLTRKRSAYLMKRAIDVASTRGRGVSHGPRPLSQMPLFTWDPSAKERLLKIWLEFFLIYETLDEVQIHVVTPVLPRIAHITKATYVSENNQELPLLHSSWLCILYQRSFVHESKTVTRLGVLECLQLDLSKSSFIRQSGVQFILGPLLNALHEEYLYTKPPDVAPGFQPPIGRALKEFLPSFVCLLPQESKSEFLVSLLELMCEQSWGPVTIFFLAEALASVPPCQAWGPPSLHLLRDKLSSGFLSCPTGYRTCIQCMLLRAGLRLLDWTAVSLHQLSSLFAVCSGTDVLKRGSPLWQEVCQSLPQLTRGHGPVAGSLSEACVKEVKGHLHVDPTAPCAGARGGGLPGEREAQRIGMMVLLVADAQSSRTSADDSPPLLSLVQPVWEILGKVGSHVYTHPLRADKALQVLEVLLRETSSPAAESNAADVVQCLTSMLSQILDEVFQYIMRCFFNNHSQCDVRRVSLYKTFLDAVLGFAASNSIIQSRTAASQGLVSRLVEGRQNLLKGCIALMEPQSSSQLTERQRWYQSFVLTSLLAWLLAADAPLPDHGLPAVGDMLTSLMAVQAALRRVREDEEGEKPEGGDQGRLQSELIINKWVATLAVVQRWDALSPDGREEIGVAKWQHILSCCVNDIGLVSAKHAVPLVKCAVLLVSKLADEDTPLCLEALAAAWCTVLDSWRYNHIFWSVYEAFLALAYQPALLQHGEDTAVSECLQKYTGKIMAQGETRLGMLNCLTAHLLRMMHSADFFRPPPAHRSVTMTIIRNTAGILQAAALYGPVVHKSARLMEDISVYLIQHDELASARPVLQANSLSTDRRLPRVHAIEILMLIGTSDVEGKEEFFEEFLMKLLKKDQDITPVKKCYIINATVHRIKLRIWQTAIVIIHFLSRDAAPRIMDGVLRSMRTENQTSTRYLIEIFVVRLLHLHPHLLKQFWEFAAEAADTVEVSFSPLLMVIAHLGTVQLRDQMESFYMRAIPTILPWTFVPTMALRVQSQVALLKMWRDCKEAGLDAVIDRFPGVAVCMDFTQNNSALYQLRKRMEGNFFLRYFHPVRDFSLETVFHTIPALTLVSEDEWVEPGLFLTSATSPWRPDGGHPVMPLYSRTDTLRNCNVKEKKKCASVKDAEIREVSWTEDDAGDVQKKIIPWREWHIPGLEPSSGPRSPRGHLVVVASLVDRLPNLGGLCRTCEIFGASCLVLGNLGLKDHQDFLSLSVSAERWLPIREVRPCDLKDYMMEMKKHGYALVGVEQTANSQSLTDFKFPRRTMLLLGKEREGIPVELIQLLDVCVEIPQLGFIRSLNVHVSGALMIWEYTRQKLLQSV